MKNKYKFLALLGFLPFLAQAQLTNNGATILIESGATLVVEGEIDNNGTITNSGTIEVQGDFDNTGGTLTSAPNTSTIEFNGASGDQTFTPSSAAVYSVVVNKTDDSNVILAGPLSVSDNLTLTQGNLELGSNDLMIGTSVTAIAGSQTSFIDADGDGKVVKEYSANESFIFPVGDDHPVNGEVYSPLIVDVTDGFASGATVSVNLDNAQHPDLPEDANNDNRNATEFLTRSWDIDQNGFTGFSAEVTGTYDDTDDKVLGSGAESLIKAAMWDGTEWSYDDADNTVSDQVVATIDESTELTGSNTFGKSTVTVILGGAYDSGTGEMRTDLNQGATGILATNQLSSPYGTGESVTAAFFGANLDIVDWIKVELRSASNNEALVAERSAFVDKDGNLLDVTGSADNDVLFFKNAPADAFIVIKHRNHLGIMLNSTSTLLSAIPDVNFTDAATTTFGTHAQRSFSGTMIMWPGNVNGDDRILSNASPSDAAGPTNRVLTDLANTGGVFGGGAVTTFLGVSDVYEVTDFNMDGKVLANASPSDSALPTNQVLNHPLNTGGVFGGGAVTTFLGLLEQLPEN